MKIRLLLALAPILLAAPVSQEARPRTMEGDHWIFFAVLEGLFSDALPGDAVDKILETDPKTGRYSNFVYACEICTPSLEAFRAYHGRHEYAYGRKGDMVGDPKAPSELTKPIVDGPAESRRAALHKLIQRYIQRRVEQLRLTEAERTALSADLAERRKSGMGMLRSMQLPWKECPSCEGANDVFKK